MKLTRKKYLNLTLFFFAIVFLYAEIAFFVLSIPLYSSAVSIFAYEIAIPFDCMVFIPCLFYFFVVRKYNLSLLAILPITCLGGLLTTHFVGVENLSPFALGLFATIFVIEVFIAAFELRRGLLAFKQAKTKSRDIKIQLSSSFFELTKSKRVAKLMSNELLVLYYALFSWRATPLIENGNSSFTYHKESGLIGLVVGLLLVLPVEIIVIHMLVSQWSPLAAWIITVLSLYSVIWIIGSCRASILRPITISDRVIRINSGLFFSVDIPRTIEVSFQKEKPGFNKAEMIDLGSFGFLDYWLVLSNPIEAETFFSGKRELRAIGLKLDNPTGFRTAVDFDHND